MLLSSPQLPNLTWHNYCQIFFLLLDYLHQSKSRIFSLHLPGESLQAVLFSITVNVKCLLRYRWMNLNSWAELLSQLISTSTHRWVCSQRSDSGWRVTNRFIFMRSICCAHNATLIIFICLLGSSVVNWNWLYGAVMRLLSFWLQFAQTLKRCWTHDWSFKPWV